MTTFSIKTQLKREESRLDVLSIVSSTPVTRSSVWLVGISRQTSSERGRGWESKRVDNLCPVLQTRRWSVTSIFLAKFVTKNRISVTDLSNVSPTF